MSETALREFLVVELGARVGAGVCGALLSQLGASVVVVEGLARPGFDRGKDRQRTLLAAGKLSFAPDLDSSADVRLLRDLVGGADAVIRSSDIDCPLGAILDESRSAGQVACDLTAYGATGPYAGRPDTDLQIQALSGIVDTTGLPDGPPVLIPFPLLEIMTGVYAAAAILAASRVRRLSGAGQVIDMALFDCAFGAISTFLPRVLEGSSPDVKRLGNRHTMAAPWNVYRARDGWVLICSASDVQWRRICEVMGRDDLAGSPGFATLGERVANVSKVDSAVASWVAGRDVAECVARLDAASIPCGPIAPIERHPREANLEHRNMIRSLSDPRRDGEYYVPASPLRMSVTPGRPPRPASAPDGDRAAVCAIASRTSGGQSAGKPAQPLSLPLAGLRVIEIGHYTTAPLAAKHLANLGAEVIKIEPPGGEATRDWPPHKNGQGYFFTYTNSDKRSIMLDLSSSEGAQTLRRLVSTSDVLIENLKPGTLARRGFASSQILDINPRIVYCAVSGFGDDSIYRGRPAFDTVIQAMSGLMDVIRNDGVPVKCGISSVDLMGAQMAVLAILAALEFRDQTGRGQFLDLSMQDIAAWATQGAWNDAPGVTHAAILRAADGFVAVDADAMRLADLMRALALDPAATGREALAAKLAAAGLIAAPILSVRETLALEQVEARKLWFLAPDASGEHWPLMASPLRLTATPPRVRQPMPRLDSDRDAILSTLDERAKGPGW